MDARVGPALFPAVQIGLRFLETLKALPLERCFLRVADPGLHFSFSIWIMDPASERYRAIVGQDISIQGIESGIVDIGTQHALFQVIENNNSRGTPLSGERLSHGVRPRCACSNATPASVPICGCCRESTRTVACGDTCRSAGHAPSDLTRNRPELLLRRRCR